MRRCAILLVVTACTDDGVDQPPDCRDVVAGVVPCEPFPSDPTVTVTWAFYPSLGGPELVGRCRDGVANVELHTSANTMVSLPCDTNRSGQIVIPFGARFLVRLVDAAGATVAESPPEDPQGRIQVRATFYEDAGYARPLWHVHAGGPGSPVPSKCFDAMPLRLAVTDAQGTPVLSRSYPCPPQGAFQLLTDPIREGTYTFEFTGLFGTEVREVPIGRNNAVTDLDVTTP